MMPTAPRTINPIARSPRPLHPYVAIAGIVVFASAENPGPRNPSITGSSIQKTMAAIKVTTPYLRVTIGLLDMLGHLN